MSGDGITTALQIAGSVNGDVNIGAGVSLPRVVDTYPAPEMIDRRDAMRALRKQIDAGTSVLTWTTIHGDPGVGTSSVALACLREIREEERSSDPRFPGGLLRVRGGRTDRRRSQWEVLEKFGITQRDLPPRADPIRALHQEIERRGPVAILVDNARDLKDVLPFVPGTEGSVLIVAGDRTAAAPDIDMVRPDDLPDGAPGTGEDIEDRLRHLEAHELHIPPLEPDDAVAMLGHAAGAEWTTPKHRALARHVCEALGRLPYLLRTYGKLIQRWEDTEGDGAGLARVAEELASLPPESPSGQGAKPSISYEAERLLAAFFNRRPKEIEYFAQNLAVHPNTPFTKELARRLAGASSAQVDVWLADLVESGLLEAPEVGEGAQSPGAGYQFRQDEVHRALRLRGEASGSGARDTMFAYYLDLAHAAHGVLLPGRPLEAAGADHPTGTVAPPSLGTARQAGTFLDQQRAGLGQVVHDAVRLGRQVHPRYLRVAYRLVAALWAYWFPRGLMDEIVDTHDALILAAENGALTPSERAQLLLQRSIALRRERDLVTARGDADRAIELAEQAPQVPLVLHSALEARGDVHLDAGETTDAIRLFTASLAVAVELPERQRPRAVLNLTHKLGRAFLADGDLVAARGLLELCAWAVGHLDHRGRPAGIVADRDGGPPRWVADAVRRLDHDDPQNLARLITSLGDLALAEGDPAAANQHWENALKTHLEAGHLRRAAELLEKRARSLHSADAASAREDLHASLLLYARLNATIPCRRLVRRLGELDDPDSV
ncbi:tetratricopeptide repeat protein [Spiractinospora alimapuensis]|uniref:tetratricopeptide repeat protein n=1 Tax=Spiractinospora alimapuensis TaxID=2820884 RepID=UPI001F31F3B3|nr:tetratricopeptide repeat protein [Spiractinospora alimapuensis]QVQ54191.1 tetratricopeptide repeat protein [Spiractinospora alimapuensis]